MVNHFKNRGQRTEAYRIFCRQKKLMEKNFPDFQCSYSKRSLTCIGTLKPTEDCANYTVKIIHQPEKQPHVFVLNPKITPDEKIHFYRDGSLCLYYPIESPWKHTDNLHEKIIPWTSEWILFFELYLLEGEWLGKSAPHSQN